MTRTPFDEFSKQLFEFLLASYGTVQASREVPGESRWIDIWFDPHTPQSLPSNLGILAQIATQPCLFEPFRNPPSRADIRACWSKLLAVQFKLDRQTKRSSTPTQPAQLWILTPTLSRQRLKELGAIVPEGWPEGVYHLPPALQTSIILLHRLPMEPETRWLRLMGRGNYQRRAIHEVLTLADTDPQREATLQLLVSWKIMVEASPDEGEREVLMNLAQVYQEWETKTKQEGRQEGQQQGRQEGRQEGRLEKAKEIALALLKEQMSPEHIALITGLSLEQVNRLQ